MRKTHGSIKIEQICEILHYIPYLTNCFRVALSYGNLQINLTTDILVVAQFFSLFPSCCCPCICDVIFHYWTIQQQHLTTW